MRLRGAKCVPFHYEVGREVHRLTRRIANLPGLQDSRRRTPFRATSVDRTGVPPDTGEVDASTGAGQLAAPMNGTIVTLLVEPGTRVESDTPLLVMEAMKMEHTIRAPAPGIVEQYYYQPGELVDGGAELLNLVPGED